MFYKQLQWSCFINWIQITSFIIFLPNALKYSMLKQHPFWGWDHIWPRQFWGEATSRDEAKAGWVVQTEDGRLELNEQFNGEAEVKLAVWARLMWLDTEQLGKWGETQGSSLRVRIRPGEPCGVVLVQISLLNNVYDLCTYILFIVLQRYCA